MRGIPLYNFPEFDRVAGLLHSAGYDVISPADLDRKVGFNPDKGDEADEAFIRAAMKRDIEAIIDRADAVALLDGWEASKGATAEVAMAAWCGKKSMHWMDWRSEAGFSQINSIQQDAQEFVSGFTMPSALRAVVECDKPWPKDMGKTPCDLPKFAEWSIPVLQESIDILNERGAQYGDTYKTCQFLHFKAVAKLLGVTLPSSPEIIRALSLAVLSDIKYERQGGAYKSDNVKDGINYLAAMDGAVQEALKTIKKNNEHPNANK